MCWQQQEQERHQVWAAASGSAWATVGRLQNLLPDPASYYDKSLDLSYAESKGVYHYSTGHSGALYFWTDLSSFVKSPF